jgi:hypothetical protein
MRLASVWYIRLCYFRLHFTDAARGEALACDYPTSAGAQLHSPIFSIFQTPGCGATSSDAETDLMPVCLDFPFCSFVEIRSSANIKVTERVENSADTPNSTARRKMLFKLWQ